MLMPVECTRGAAVVVSESGFTSRVFGSKYLHRRGHISGKPRLVKGRVEAHCSPWVVLVKWNDLKTRQSVNLAFLDFAQEGEP